MADQEQAPEAAAEVPKSGMKKMLPLLLMVLGGLIVGGAGGAFMAGPALAKKFMPAKPMTAEDSAKAAEEAEKAAEHEGEGGKEGAGPKVFLLDNMVMNPAGSSGQRFLLVSIALRLKSSAVEEELKARDAEVRDALLRVLGSKHVEELSDITQRDAIKEELRKAIDGLLKPGSVKGLYFPQFVIQ